MTKIVKPIVDSLKPGSKAGRPPVVRHCPYCQAAMNTTAMRKHMPQCEQDQQPAPQPPTPDDLEAQILSDDPLQRRRQLDQREQDRIQRS